MERLQELRFRSNCHFSERFQEVLPHFLTLLEGEFRQAGLLMNPEVKALLKDAHRALGQLRDELEIGQTVRVA
jgi:hypothetical protein